MRQPIRFFAPRTSYASGRAMHGDMIQGLKELTANFGHFCNGIANDILPGVMADALEPTLELSNYYAPVDTGEMVDSGYVEVVRTRHGPTAEVGYGRGGRAPYTVFVHENPEAFHEPPTQYKFLQRAMDEDMYGIFLRISRLAKERMGL